MSAPVDLSLQWLDREAVADLEAVLCGGHDEKTPRFGGIGRGPGG